MLVMDERDEMCWRQLYDFDDTCVPFGHQQPLSFYNNVLSQQHPQIIKNFRSPTSLSQKNPLNFT